MSASLGSFVEVLTVFARLGLTSFGGPVAHLGFFRAELVERRKWLSDDAYADLVALCQFLPGPASSQVGISLGYLRAGVGGALAAWIGFTLPSAIALALFAAGVQLLGDVEGAAWLRGFKIVAVAVVAQALWGMARQLTPDVPRIALAITAAAIALLWTSALAQVVIIAGGAGIGVTLLRRLHQPATRRHEPVAPGGISRRTGIILLALFAAILLLSPMARGLGTGEGSGTPAAAAVFDAFYRVGSLVFGGGHVVLPLLNAEVTVPGWVDQATFTAGYGAAQAVPGPLFTFSAFLGASMAPGAAGALLATVALVAIFLPSFLLVLGILPFWQSLRQQPRLQQALVGVNAAVVGLLLAALIHPVGSTAIAGLIDVALISLAYLALTRWRVTPWMVVLGGAALTSLLGVI